MPKCCTSVFTKESRGKTAAPATAREEVFKKFRREKEFVMLSNKGETLKN
jgi:hypothetical protein